MFSGTVGNWSNNLFKNSGIKNNRQMFITEIDKLASKDSTEFLK